LRHKGVVPSAAGLRFFSLFPPRTLAILSQVCKSLRLIVSHDIIWRPLCIARWSELEMATRVEDDPFPAWKACYTRRVVVKQTELKDIMQDRELGRCDWYTCSQGHLYMIGECRLPMFLAKCPTCGERIGGRHHTMETSNKRIGSVYKEGLMNKTVSVDDVQAVVAGKPASKSHREEHEDRSKVQYEEKSYSKRQEAAMKELHEWLTQGSRNDDAILARVTRAKYLDSLSTFRVLLGFFASSSSSRAEMNEISQKITEHGPSLFAYLAKTPGDQAVLIGALEEFCAKTPYTNGLFVSIMQAFHHDQVLNAKTLKQWITSSTESSWLINKHLAIGLRTKMKDYVKSI